TFGTRGRDVDLNVPRYIEIGTSVAAEPETFESVATVRVRPDVVEQLVRFPPHPARYVRLRLLDTYADDGGSVRLGEVRVIEAAPPSESVVPRDARNLA